MDDPVFTVSHSQVNNWLKCKHSWKWAYLDRWTPKTKNIAMGQGSVFHAMLASLFKNEPIETQQAILLDWITDDFQNRSALGAKIGNLFARYKDEYYPLEYGKRSVVAVEYPFLVDLRTPSNIPYRLEGHVDLICNGNGKMFIEDHKTHTNRAWSLVQVQMDSQLPTYAAALRHLGYPVYGVSINLINLYDYKDPASVPVDKLFKRVVNTPSDREFDNIFHQFGLAVDEMIFYTGMGSSKFIKNLSRDCDRCQFQEPCWIQNKGLDPEPFLMSNFKKKDAKEERDDWNAELA